MFDNSSHADLSGLKCDGGPRLSVPKVRRPALLAVGPGPLEESSDQIR